jgi:hypothetical protein
MARCRSEPWGIVSFDPLAPKECPSKKRRRSGRRVFCLAATRMEPAGRVRFVYRVRLLAHLGKHSRRRCRGAWLTVVRLMRRKAEAPAQQAGTA